MTTAQHRRLARGREHAGLRFACAVVAAAVAFAIAAAATDPAPGLLDVDRSYPRDATGVAYGPRPEQVLDVHRPAGGGAAVPVVLFAHSGGWIAGSRREIPGVIAALSGQLGVAVVSIDYRLVATAPGGAYTNTFPTPMWDLDRAIRFVRLHAPDWGLDPDRIVVAGASAGGQLAALAGAAPGRFADPELPPDLAGVNPAVQGVIDEVGPTDFWTFPAAGGWAPALTAALLGCAPARPDTCAPARVADATVATHLQGRPPPAYFAYGERDTLVVPATQGEPIAAAWAAARGEELSRHGPGPGAVRYVDLPDADHNITAAEDGGLLARWLLPVLDGGVR